jgi:hypothetical protein
MHPLELAGRQLVILDGDGQAPHGGIERGSLGDGPGAQHLVGLESHTQLNYMINIALTAEFNISARRVVTRQTELPNGDVDGCRQH